MNTLPDIPKQELELAKLAGAKLAIVLEGMFTAGLGAMLLQGFYLPLSQTRLAMALMQVLRSTWCPLTSETAMTLTNKTDELDLRFSRFYCLFVTLADWRNMDVPSIEVTVNDLAAAYWQVVESLSGLLEWLGVRLDLTHQRELRDATPASFLKQVRSSGTLRR